MAALDRRSSAPMPYDRCLQPPSLMRGMKVAHASCFRRSFVGRRAHAVARQTSLNPPRRLRGCDPEYRRVGHAHPARVSPARPRRHQRAHLHRAFQRFCPHRALRNLVALPHHSTQSHPPRSNLRPRRSVRDTHVRPRNVTHPTFRHAMRFRADRAPRLPARVLRSVDACLRREGRYDHRANSC